MLIDEVIGGNYDVLKSPQFLINTIKRRVDLITVVKAETRTAAAILTEMQDKLSQVTQEDFIKILDAADPSRSEKTRSILKLLVWDYELLLTLKTDTEPQTFRMSLDDWSVFDKILDTKAAKLDAIERVRTHPLRYIRAYDPNYIDVYTDDGADINVVKILRHIASFDTYLDEHPHHKITSNEMYRLVKGTDSDKITPKMLSELDSYINLLNDLECTVVIRNEEEGTQTTIRQKLISIATIETSLLVNGALVNRYYRINDFSALRKELDGKNLESISVFIPAKHLKRSRGKATDTRTAAEYILAVSAEKERQIRVDDILKSVKAVTSKQQYDARDVIKDILKDHYEDNKDDNIVYVAELFDDNGNKTTASSKNGFTSISFTKHRRQKQG